MENSIKLADRMKALQWLSDHMDLATEEQRARIARSRLRRSAYPPSQLKMKMMELRL